MHDELPGEGPPIVLLHGVLDGPDAWTLVARHLHDAGRRVLVHHAPAHGRAAPYAPGLDWSPRAAAEDALPLLGERAHVVGHSRGGTSAAWLAVEHPERVLSLAVVASPPQATEAFRATFRRRLPGARNERETSALEYLARIPDDDFPEHALRRVDAPALVVEYEDDALYSPTHTMFWRMFLPYASFERVPGGHRAFAENEKSAAWLARRLLAHVASAETA